MKSNLEALCGFKENGEFYVNQEAVDKYNTAIKEEAQKEIEPAILAARALKEDFSIGNFDHYEDFENAEDEEIAAILRPFFSSNP